MIVASRISVNYLYINLVKRWKFFVLPEHRLLNNVYVEHIVSVIKIICKQYIKHFSYHDFIVIFDNLTSDEFNDLFKVIIKKIGK